MKKLAVITTHPIQYYAPVFKLLHERGKVEIMVYYTWGEQAKDKFDPGFGATIAWDIPLLEGYPFTWVKNTAQDAGSHHFKGIFNPGLIQQVQDWKPDAVLIFGWAYQSHLKCLRYFKGRRPVYFRGDSTLLDESKGLKKIFRSFFLKWVYKHVDCAFYTGSNNKDYFKKFGLTDKQLVFAPHAVDNDRFSADRSTEAKALRKQLNIGEIDILVLFAGKLEDKKSPMELLDAFASLNKPGMHLLFAGNGQLEEKLKLKAVDLKNIHFTGFQNQTVMPVIYQACDLFCLPSKGPGETWGLAVNEAMACGKAVLLSDKVGCAVDLVKKSYNGDIFEGGNRDALENSLTCLTQSKTRLIEMGRNSAAMINEWSFLNIAQAIEDKLTHASA
ncbi:MAG TPA: glycosyltransferase family 4 protein [Mucilaginibacter sp.]|nr:glycosyltransferase family 4 protein [Mucilaginibacter sp.]